MNDFNTDPAAQVKYLKALEKAKLADTDWPAPAKTQKWTKTDDAAKGKKTWPAVPNIVAKLKEAWPQPWQPMMDDTQFTPWQQGGMSQSEIIRALFYIAGGLLFILLTEVL